MASIAAAFATSHSLMLASDLEDWLVGFRASDPRMPYYDAQGEKTTFSELLQKAPSNAAELITDEAVTQCFEKAQKSMQRLRAAISAARLNALIVVGDDQHELFDDSHMPSIGIYYGEWILNKRRPINEETDWFKRAQSRRLEPENDVEYPVDSNLALHLIQRLRDSDFDVAAIKGLRSGQFEGHAFSYIHRYCIPSLHLPIVPIFLNTWFPPNQPTPKRCIQLGDALASAIAIYPSDMRIGVIASGGLSHFIIDEEMDRGIIQALERGTPDLLAKLNPARLKAGSSEIRNWIVLAAAARGMTLSWISYIPAYRSPALTGTGLGFAVWGNA
jgi:hypothetical protein